ncbi:hypothetical protein [Acidocella sp.]|uniref:hypothetical protein n=1 Tax=Acidocella sp. TaxID=50710 RepID=UPI003D00E2B5
MTPQALAKLDLLATAEETSLLAAVNRHQFTLRRYTAQREVMAAYHTRLAAGWRGGTVVQAGQAQLAGLFSTQAETAMAQLDQAIQAEQALLQDSAMALAKLRIRRRALQDKLATALRLAENTALERAAQNRPAPRRQPPTEREIPA